MQTQEPLRGDDLQALRADPPRDEHGQLIPWTLGHRILTDHRLDQAVQHRGLTLHDSTFRGFSWSGDIALYSSLLRDLVLDRVAFTGLRFEDVVFERCRFDTLQLTDCTFVRCRFIGGDLTLLTATRCSFIDTRFEDLSGDTWNLRDCSLTGSSFRGCTLLAPRLSHCTIDRLQIGGGGLHGAELTISNARIGELGLDRCPLMVGPRVLDSTLRALDIQDCPQLPGLVVQNCELGRLTVRRSTLQAASLVAVTTRGRLTLEDSALIGLVVREGAWADALLERCTLAAYIAVDHTRFTAVQTPGLIEADDLQHQLDGQPTASATFWGAIHGP